MISCHEKATIRSNHAKLAPIFSLVASLLANIKIFYFLSLSEMVELGLLIMARIEMETSLAQTSLTSSIFLGYFLGVV